jgi:hypothetical protein
MHTKTPWRPIASRRYPIGTGPATFTRRVRNNTQRVPVGLRRGTWDQSLKKETETSYCSAQDYPIWGEIKIIYRP